MFEQLPPKRRVPSYLTYLSGPSADNTWLVSVDALSQQNYMRIIGAFPAVDAADQCGSQRSTRLSACPAGRGQTQKPTLSCSLLQELGEKLQQFQQELRRWVNDERIFPRLRVQGCFLIQPE